MVQFQIASDLHIESNLNQTQDPLDLITPSAGILILAGDIGSFYKHNQLKTFLDKLCVHFNIVLYVPGNNEYYSVNGYETQSMATLLNNFVSISSSIKNLQILNCSSVIINDICILGCTLWSEPFMNVPKFIVRIPEMTTRIYKQTYDTQLGYIKKMIKYCKKKELKLLVITHHGPTYSAITNTKKLNDKYVSLYASNLDKMLVKQNVHTWVYGHIHINVDKITDDGTHLVSNQLGKKNNMAKNYSKKHIIIV